MMANPWTSLLLSVIVILLAEVTNSLVLLVPSTPPPPGSAAENEILLELFKDTKPLLPLDFEGAGRMVSGIASEATLPPGTPVLRTPAAVRKFLRANSTSSSEEAALPPDPKVWACLLSRPPTASTASQIQTIPDPTSSYPYLLSSSPPIPTSKPTLVFLHGSFHSPTCYSNFLPFFAARGYHCVAPPLRGTSSGHPPSPTSNKPGYVKMSEHVSDLSSYLSGFPPSSPPVLVSHSFSSLLLFSHLQQQSSPPSPRRRACAMCGVPPTGNVPMTLRYLRRDLGLSLDVVRGMAMKGVASSIPLARRLFFDADMPDGEVEGWVEGFGRDSKVMIDLRDLSGRLPCREPPPVNDVDWLVIGAEDDKVVDWEGVEETAGWLGVEGRRVEASHDVMLGGRWENAAYELLEWLERGPLTTKNEITTT